MRAPAIVLATSVALAVVLTACASEGAEPTTVQLSTFEPSNAAWTRGTLEVVPKSGNRSIISLDFSMPRGEIESLIIKTRSKSIDISKEASQLPEPYPLRSQAWIYRANKEGMVEDAVITIPFKSRGDNCMALRIHLTGSGVADLSRIAAPNVRCEQ